QRKGGLRRDVEGLNQLTVRGWVSRAHRRLSIAIRIQPLFKKLEGPTAVSSQTLNERRPSLRRPFYVYVWDGTAPVPPLPSQYIELSLVRPIFRSRHKAGTNRILHNILPFLIVTLSPAQLCVPKMTLPNWRVSGRYPGARRSSLPILDPL